MWQIRALIVLAIVSALAGLRMTAEPPGALTAQERHVIPDEPTCPQCTIELTTVAIIGDVDGPSALPRWPQTAWVDRLRGYWLTFDPGLEPMLFDRSGGNPRTPLRVGDGPGEVRLVREVLSLPGDSTLVIDATGRAVVLGPDLRAERTVQLPGFDVWHAVIAHWPHQVAMNAISRRPEYIGWPLHLADWSGSAMLPENSFGPDGDALEPEAGHGVALRQFLTTPHNGTFWAADLMRYRLTQWSLAGKPIRMLSREPRWFRGVSPLSMGDRTHPPSPYVVGVSEDSAGHIWMFIHIIGRNYAAAWRDIPATGSGELPASAIHISDLYQTRVEVLDAASARIISSRDLPFAVLSVLPGPELAAYRPGPFDAPSVAMIGLRLHHPDRGNRRLPGN